MLFKQIPQPAPELQTWSIDRNYLQFELSPTMSVLDTAEFQRMNGPIYNILTLYTHHNGPLPCLQTNSDVRSAIINELRRDHIRHNYVGTIDVSSNDRFKPREFRCLLQALLNGTLLPTQYSGRMLPYSLINFLRTHVDDATQTRFNYAYLRLDASQVNVRMFWNIIESDTILAITTAPYTDLQHWFISFCAAIRQNNFPDPVVIVRNHIHDHEISFAAEASHIVSTQIELLLSTLMTTIRENGFTLTPPSSPPTADSPMTNLEQRLLAFHHSIRNTPPRQSPELRPRANREIHDEVTRHYSIALLSPYGSAFHKRHATYMRRQEFLFRSNMAEHLARFGETPTTDYSLIVPPTLVSRSLIPNYSLAADVLPPRPLSPFSRGIILAHESQQQIQRDYITNAGVTSNAAATILAMNTQSVLDAACSISGSSSRHPHSTHTGILSRTIPLQATATTINHPPPRPKPLNFGLD